MNVHAHAGGVKSVSHADLPPPPLRVDQKSTVLFLDFDGTLIDIAKDPDAISVDKVVPDLLDRLHSEFRGRVCIVTGRDCDVLRAYLPGFRGPVYGSHGLELDECGERSLTVHELPDTTAWNAMAEKFCRSDGRLRYERKKWGPAIHFRSSPSLEPKVQAFLNDLADRDDRMDVYRSKCALELRPNLGDKGYALCHAIMRFGWDGLRPVHFGDDTTDEAAFNVVNSLNGDGVKVGAGDTEARYRLATPSDVHTVLRRWASKE